MYQYFVGFVFGVYVGTRYEMKTYVDSTEKSVLDFFQNIKKRDNTNDNLKNDWKFW